LVRVQPCLVESVQHRRENRPTSIVPPPFVEYLFIISHISSFSNILCCAATSP
jgi:hypothetical protein